MKKSIGIFCLILLALLIAPATAATLYVDDDGGEGVYTTIKDAIDAAAEGDTIFVRAGIYPWFEVEKSHLTITGEGADLVTVDFKGADVGIELRGNGILLEGLTVLKSSEGLAVFNPDCIVRDCVFDGLFKSDMGIRIKSSNLTFENNTIKDATTTYSVLYMEEVDGTKILNNHFINNTAGLLPYHSNNCTIAGNTFSSNGKVIGFYDPGNGFEIYSNTLTDNKVTCTWEFEWNTPFKVSWNSTTPLTYAYKDTTHTGYLGNSWSDYTGDDTNNDGVIDTPYDLPDGLGTDHAPLTAAGGEYEVLVPQTLYVDDDGGDGVYTTIQEAVDAAQCVDTIVVRDGAYTENVLVDKGLTIRTENGTKAVTVTAKVPEKPVFDLKADGITVEGFSVRGPTNEHVAGIESVGYDDCRIIGNDCGGACYNGIHLGGDATGNLIEANTCHDNTRRGISLRDDVTGNTVFNNTCWNNADDELCVKDNPTDNVIWANAFFGTVECLNPNTYHSPEMVTYTYNDAEHTGYVGNYYGGYTGTDADGDGIGDEPMLLGIDSVTGDYHDDYPMMGVWQDGAIAKPAPVLTGITVKPGTFEAETGETWQFNATGLNWDTSTIPGLDLTWTTSDESIGTVNETGWFEAVKPGTVTLTAACGEIEGTADVTVVAPATLTSIEIIKYAPDGVTVAENKTVSIRWMQRHLPLLGGENGTMLRFQGPSFDKNDPWNPAEDLNLGKVNNTVKGTALADLCDLVGGVYEGGEIQFAGRDNFPGKIPSSAVLAPNERQGPAMIAWWDAKMGEYPEWGDGPQLFFLTPDGVFGNDDMRTCFGKDYHHYWTDWPSAAGMSVKKITTIKIVPEPREDWSLSLSGAITRKIDRSYFEQAVTCTQASHGATWTDGGKTWSGVPLWLLCGWVDDTDQHAPFRDDLADAGYTVVLIDYGADGLAGTADDRSVEFNSSTVKKNNKIILANEIDDWPLAKGDWPLKLVGSDVPAEKRLGSVDAIRLVGLAAGDGGMVITLEKGWNFVSTPRTLAPGNDTAGIFANVDCAGHSIYTFDTRNGLWKTLGKDDKILPLQGVWVYAKQVTNVPLTFSTEDITTPPTLRLAAGWNAVGYSDIEPQPTRDALESVKDTWAILIGFDAANQVYERSAINGAVGSHVDTLPMEPGRGYWLFMRADGTLAAISA
ncbi:NosD domain-containing protein [uncultured Methanofollis sp.]|uniref:NosD domain-containing protein n=1 Tax=uncultured Methanofollis sp. TaxID=262500 RepID=UPI002603C63E|nr:NosD domain-containing protein [uncultured Methanofollis sp.]